MAILLENLLSAQYDMPLDHIEEGRNREGDLKVHGDNPQKQRGNRWVSMGTDRQAADGSLWGQTDRQQMGLYGDRQTDSRWVSMGTDRQATDGSLWGQTDRQQMALYGTNRQQMGL